MKTISSKTGLSVIDEDALSVEIRQAEPFIEGGGVYQIDGFSAVFRWRPTSAQVAASLSYTLHLEADDGDNPPVPQDYEIVIISG